MAPPPRHQLVAAILQPTLQVALALFLTSLLTFVSQLRLSLSCLAAVFVLVLHILLVQNFHVGTQLLSAASLLGCVWSGIAAAGVVVTITMQIPSRAAHIALVVILGSAGLALACLVRVSARQFPQLFLQGTNLLMTFGMSVVLSFFAPSVRVLWSTYLAHMLLAFTAACLASVVAGLLVLPSLATAAALSNVITALNRAGQNSTMCISILLAPLHLLGKARPGDPQQQHIVHSQRQQQQQSTGIQLSQQPSLLFENPLSASELSTIVERASQPGQWGLRSFLAANNAAAAAVGVGVGGGGSSGSGSGSGIAAASAPSTQASAAEAAATAAPAPPVATAPLYPSGSASPPPATAAAGDDVDEDDEDWGHDHYEEDDSNSTDLVSADANVQLGVPGSALLRQVGSGGSHRTTLSSGSIASSCSGGGGVRITSSSNHHPVAAARPAAAAHSLSAATTAAKPPKLPQLLPPSASPTNHLQSHPLMRLQRGVDQIRPLLAATKQLQGAVAVEQAWWVGLLVRYRAREVVDAGAWQRLVEALEALVMRIAALESMLEGGHDYASLAQLTSFEALAETCGAVFAQAAALCGATSTQLADKLAQTQQQGDLVYAVGCMARAVCGRSRGSGSSTSKSSTSKTTAAGQPAPGSSAASGQHIHHSAFNHTAASPSINAANTSSAIPTALLCSSSCFNWGLAKQHLVRVLEKETQIYYAALVQAAKDRPFRLDPARTMTSLMFLVVLSMGVIEACQTLQTAAQAVLAPGGSSSRGSSSNSSSNKTVATPSSHSRGSGSSAGAVRLAKGQTMPPAGATSGATCASSSSSSVVVAGSSDNKAAVSPAAAAAASGTTTSTITTSSSSANHHHTVQLFSSSTWMLLRVFLMVDVGLRIWDALALQLPAACKSWAAFRAQLADRRFQAGFKAWLACTIALVVIAAAYTHIAFLGTSGPSVFMFGFMSLVFTMRERVESSMEMVIFRVGATVVGACVGHLFMFHAATTYNPYILAAANIFFCLVLVPFSLGQFRLVVVLALLTFASVTLCQYAGCCRAVGNITYLVGRILATGGGALFAMLLNRLLWPWRRNRWAMEEFSRALDIAVVAANKMYAAEYAHLSACSSGAGADAASDTAVGLTAAAISTANSQQTTSTGHVVVELSAANTVSSPPPVPSQAAAAAPSAHTAAAAPKAAALPSGPGTAAAAADVLSSKSPEQLQQMLGAILMPVQISIARDTWVQWKRGALALTPSVPLMLSAVQQLLDALSALHITHKMLTTTISQPPTLQPLNNTLNTGSGLSSGTSSNSSSNSQSRSPAECVQWQQRLLLHELVQPIHGSFCGLLQQLSALVQLVRAHVRQPTEVSRASLLAKIQEVHDLRVSVSLEYVQLRNHRHSKMRQQLSALWQQQQRQAQQQQGMDGGDNVPGRNQAASSGTVPADGSAGGWCARSHAGFQHQVLSTVQYMAFIHALRRFFDRAVAVARCAADARF